MKINLSRETLEERNEMMKDMEKRKLLTGIRSIDKTFRFLMKGSVYGVCAPTGIGKTTFLFATAKKMAADGKKVLYLSIEMSIMQLLPFCPEDEPNLTIEEFDGQWDLLAAEITVEGYDVICYDYIGAKIDSWDELISEADKVAEFAKKNDLIVFTALQASPALLECSDEQMLYTNYYVAFSRGMINKFAGAAYIINDKNKNSLYCMKNRYAEQIRQPIVMEDLDYKNKAWVDINERKNQMETSAFGAI